MNTTVQTKDKMTSAQYNIKLSEWFIEQALYNMRDAVNKFNVPMWTIAYDSWVRWTEFKNEYDTP